MSSWKLLLPIVLLFAQGVSSQEKPSNPFNFKWDNGFKLESQDSLFSLEFGGSLLVDHGYFHQDRALTDHSGPLESKSGTEIRRARLFFSGSVYGNTHFKFQVDFAGNEVALKDAYIGLSNIPAVGNLLIGHFKEPFRLSSLTSSKYSTFMEGGANGYFSQSRNNGAMVFNDFLNNRLSAQFGVFRNANNNSSQPLTVDGHVLTGRLTGLPIRKTEQSQLLHLGIAYSFRNPQSREFQIAILPGSHLAEKYLATGLLEFVNDMALWNFEAAYIHGPFSLQTEYLTASVNADDKKYHFSNYYGEFSYFITGESKNYKNSYEGFGRIRPKRNFGGPQKGAGAWEVALRYSKTDLSLGPLHPGEQTEMAFGINWYLNPVTRMMLNYVKADLKDFGNLDIVQARFQIDF